MGVTALILYKNNIKLLMNGETKYGSEWLALILYKNNIKQIIEGIRLIARDSVNPL